MAKVAFDYTNLAEVEGGITGEDLRELRPRLEGAVDDFFKDLPGFMRLPKTTEPSKALAEEVRNVGATDFVHIGIGGSALGPIALHRALNQPYYNLLADRGDSPGPRLHFAENTDPATLSAILDTADLSSTWVNVVTKSGSTAETMANFLVVRGVLAEALGEEGYGDHVVFTTDPEEDYLNQIAEREETRTLPIPPTSAAVSRF